MPDLQETINDVLARIKELETIIATNNFSSRTPLIEQRSLIINKILLNKLKTGKIDTSLINWVSE